MMKKGRAQNLAMLAAVAVLVYLLFTMNNKSAYSIREREYSMLEMAPAAGPSAAAPAQGNGCGMEKGAGLASSLLPREVASAEDFGEFAPEDILAGQNFLEPRQPTNPCGTTKCQGTIRLEQLHHCPRQHDAFFVLISLKD